MTTEKRCDCTHCRGEGWEYPREVYQTGSFDDFLRRIPAPIVQVLLDHFGVTEKQIRDADVSFTFYKSSSAGVCRHKRIPRGSPLKDFRLAVNVDMEECQRKPYVEADPIHPVYASIAHEFCHMADILVGRFQPYRVGPFDHRVVFEGVEYEDSVGSPRSASDYRDYRNQPWEVRANEQADLFVKKLRGLGLIPDHWEAERDGPNFQNDPLSDKAKEVIAKEKWTIPETRQNLGAPTDVLAMIAALFETADQGVEILPGVRVFVGGGPLN